MYLVLPGQEAVFLAPLQYRISVRLRGRRAFAAALLVIGVILILVVPLASLSTVIVTESIDGAKFVVDSVKSEGGKSLAQATPEITAKLNAEKRKEAIEDVVDKLQNAIDNGSNFTEAAAEAKIPVTSILPLRHNGTVETPQSRTTKPAATTAVGASLFP